MKASEIIKTLEWTKNWEGAFSMLSAISSIGAGVYIKDMKRYFGVNVPHALLIHRSGTVTCYLVDTELQAFGEGLFTLVKSDPQLIKKWCDKIKLETDTIAGISKKTSKALLTPARFKKFGNTKIELSCYQIAMKQLIDNLTPTFLEKYGPLIEQTRRYSELVYFDIEKILNSMLERISEKTGIPKELLSTLNFEEMKDYLDRGVLPDQGLLKERYRFSAYLYTSIVEMISEEEIKEIEKFWTKNTKELQGKTAFPGIVKGVCRVIIDYKNADLKKGEILVTGMTDPNFVPLMKKASAIVTDAGGILSHAAIVSRELRTPCVIGTKHATRILKSGDIIKVNANTGIITILSRKY